MEEAQAFSDVELAAIRRDFPVLEKKGRGGNPIVYLDASATSQKPNCVIEAEVDFYRHSNGAVHRNTHLLGDEATRAYEDAREKVATFVGARPNEIVWTKNATEGLNLVASGIANASVGLGGAEAKSLAVGPGDQIVVTRAEHHANLVPWQQLAKRTGATLAWLDLLPDGRIDLDTLDRITGNTKIVAFTHASNVTGAVSPVEQILAAAKNVGALTVLDTCQSSAHMPVDVKDLGVDFAVFSAHKMLGPTGVGAVWGKSHLLETLPPVITGGSIVSNVTMENTEFLPAPDKFEAGSQPIAQAIGWAMALDYLSELGMDRIAKHEEQVTARILAGMAGIEGIRILGPTFAEGRTGAVAFAVDGVHPHDVGQFLDFNDIAVRAGHHCAIPLHRFFGVRSSSRASVALTTTNDEVDTFLEALEKVTAYFQVGRSVR